MVIWIVNVDIPPGGTVAGALKVNVPSVPLAFIGAAITAVPAVADNVFTIGAAVPARALFPNGSINCSVTVLAVPIWTVLGFADNLKSVAWPANVIDKVPIIPPPFAVTVILPTVVVDFRVTPVVIPVIVCIESLAVEVPVPVKVPADVVIVTGTAVAGFTTLPNPSFKVQVITDVETPSAAITLGVAVPVKVVALPPFIVITAVVAEYPPEVPVTVRVPASIDAVNVVVTCPLAPVIADVGDKLGA